MTTTTQVRRTPDAHRERALTELLNERGLTGPTSATVETGSDGVCVVTLTMAELDWLVERGAEDVADDGHICGQWDDDDLHAAVDEGRAEVLAGLKKLESEPDATVQDIVARTLCWIREVTHEGASTDDEAAAVANALAAAS